MGNLAAGQQVKWGRDRGVVVADVGRELVWVERGDGDSVLALRTLIELPEPDIGSTVKWQWRAGVATVAAKYVRPSGQKMVVLEYDDLGGYVAPVDEVHPLEAVPA